MFVNSVVVLRENELPKVKKPFIARGSNLKRCFACMLGVNNCICDFRPSVESQCAFCFLFYQGEVFKPSNTGRLVADVVADNYAFQWARTEHNVELISLIENPQYLPIVIFPHEYARSRKCIDKPSELKAETIGRKPLFIMLDGTWREAKKMFRSEYLHDLPVLGIRPDYASDYQLRESAHSHQLCTAEVAIEVLRLNEDTKAAEALSCYFKIFRERYLAGRANIIV